MRVLVFIVFSNFSLVGCLGWAGALETLGTSETGRSWLAVGRLTFNGGGGFCTASLIAPDVVLTAAHCVYDMENGKKYGLEDFEFQAGWRYGQAEASRNVRAVLPHPKYDFADEASIEKVRQDLALVILDHPITNKKIVPFIIADLPITGQQVAVVSYAKGRQHAPSIQNICAVRAEKRGVLVMTCEVDYGASGSPVFLINDAGVAIVSLISAMAHLKQEKFSLGVALAQNLSELEEIAYKAGLISKRTKTFEFRR